MLSGCALIKNSNEEKINTITPVGSAKFEAYGAERMDALGMVATKVESRCSAVEFFKYVTKVYPAADDVIDVSMEETTIQKGAATSYSCKYSGLAVSYTPLNIDEAKKWTPKTQKQEVVVVEKPAVPAPACVPCLKGRRALLFSSATWIQPPSTATTATNGARTATGCTTSA